MIALVVKIQREASFYMINSEETSLGMVYDRNGDVLFDGTGKGEYPDGHFIDVGNLIGDDKGQMENTLVANNIQKLNNYSFSTGFVSEDGKAAIYTTLDHAANRAVYDAFGYAEGCAVAYNYKTGEILVCTSLPSFDFTKGYDDIANFKSGTLISKNMYGTVPGSTQKVSTVIAALEIMGADKLYSKRYNCTGSYLNKSGDRIDCHNAYGHGTLDIQLAIENSCNPFFAQLIEDDDLPLGKLKKVYETLGYAVNGEDEEYIDINGIKCEKAPLPSTTLMSSRLGGDAWVRRYLVSPVQLIWQSAIANETGKVTMPYHRPCYNKRKGERKDSGLRQTFLRHTALRKGNAPNNGQNNSCLSEHK